MAGSLVQRLLDAAIRNENDYGEAETGALLREAAAEVSVLTASVTFRQASWEIEKARADAAEAEIERATGGDDPDDYADAHPTGPEPG